MLPLTIDNTLQNIIHSHLQRRRTILWRGLFVYSCVSLGKLRVDDNIMRSFWNQKVFNTALERWAPALQESTNKHFEAWHWKNLNNIENQRFLYKDVGQDAFYWMSNNMPSVSKTKAKNKPLKMKINRFEYAMRRSFQMLLPHIFDFDTSGSAESIFSCKSWTYACQSYGL